MPGYYYPRMLVRLDVPVEGADKQGGIATAGAAATTTAGGAVQTILCPVRSLTHVSNSHLEADTLSATLDWYKAGVDPRVLTSAVVTAYVWDDFGPIPQQPLDTDIRFVGVMKRPQRTGAEGQGMSVEILAHDYTALFLEAKKFPTDGVPLLTDTLEQAWGRICDHTGAINPSNPAQILPTVKALRNRLVFEGGAEAARTRTLGEATVGRFRSIGRVQTKGLQADAWAVWQQTCGMLGLISYIDLDTCVVTTATDYYTATRTPVFVWGRNVESLVEDRDTTLCGKGVCLQSFDPLSGTQLESFYPALGDASTIRKKISAKKRADVAALLAGSDYEAFAYPGVTEQKALDAVCERVYQELAHQELEGRLVTAEFQVDVNASGVTTDNGQGFDMLSLRAGDAIEFKVDQGAFDALGTLTSDDQKVSYLVGLGYDIGLAGVIVANLKGILALAPVYIVKRVTLTFETDDTGGRFRFEIAYCSKIDPSGTSTSKA